MVRTVGRSRYRRYSSRRSGGSQRRYHWVRSYSTTAVAPVANHVFTLIPPSALDPGARVGSTVIRSIGVVQINAGPATSPVGGFFAGMAVNQGGSVPATPPILPVGDENSVNWMHWSYNPFSALGVGVASTTSGNSYSWRFDVKSSRVISAQEENLLLVIQNNGIEATTGIVIAVSVLLKLA